MVIKYETQYHRGCNGKYNRLMNKIWRRLVLSVFVACMLVAGLTVVAAANPQDAKIQIKFYPDLPGEKLTGAWYGLRELSLDESAVFKVIGKRTFDANQDMPFILSGLPLHTRVPCAKNPRKLEIPEPFCSPNWVSNLLENAFELNLSDKNYTLSVNGYDRNGPSEDLHVTLSGDKGSQVIWSRKQDGDRNIFMDDSNISIAWAGDLDGDNKLDLVLNLTLKYSFVHIGLFLSSQAKPGDLVALVAEEWKYAC